MSSLVLRDATHLLIYRSGDIFHFSWLTRYLWPVMSADLSLTPHPWSFPWLVLWVLTLLSLCDKQQHLSNSLESSAVGCIFPSQSSPEALQPMFVHRSQNFHITYLALGYFLSCVCTYCRCFLTYDGLIYPFLTLGWWTSYTRSVEIALWNWIFSLAKDGQYNTPMMLGISSRSQIPVSHTILRVNSTNLWCPIN